MELPDTEQALVIRTDFTSDITWDRLCTEIQQPRGEFRAYVDPVSDLAFNGMSVDQIKALSKKGKYRMFIFVVDQETFSDPEHPVLVVDLTDDPIRTFRVIPSEIPGVENNLSIGNMSFYEFADNTDSDGVFRGFQED